MTGDSFEKWAAEAPASHSAFPRVAGVRNAPTRLGGIARELGPGLIIAASVVGSGELIATTIAGAEAGFYLLWLIVFGCVIKVFVQLEIGKYTVLSGRTMLDNIARMPGWRPGGMHWIGWAAMAMLLMVVAQMGGVAGGVGQALSIGLPISETERAFNTAADERVRLQVQSVALAANAAAPAPGEPPQLGAAPMPVRPLPRGPDALVWTLLVSVLTSALLFRGRYGLVERVCLVLVAGFTLVSFLNLFLLQGIPAWQVSGGDLLQGFSFQLPPAVEGVYPLATALAAFGIIGMAGGELVFYPYWCLEKGYARHVGPNDGSPAWAARARGWIRVMRYDAWGSLVLYTISTVAFYLLGAAVLGRMGLHPQGSELIRTLAAMYEPAFGEWAVGLFIFGAVAVLYSTFFVNNASIPLIWTDIFYLLRKQSPPAAARDRLRSGLAVALPIVSFGIFYLFPNPRVLVLLAGMTQTFALPLLGLVALNFRFRPDSRQFGHSRSGTVFLILSILALAVAGGWLLLTLLFPQVRQFG
jgi:Mn2+/Fe2+ NRAMP family transporter